LSILVGDFEAQLPGGAGDNAEGRFVVARVQVFAFGVDDVHDLFARDFADLGLVRFFGAGGDVGRLLQQHGGRRRLRDKGERFVFVNGDDDRENVAGLLLGGGVKFFAERHDVNPARTKRGADGRRRVSLTGRNLEFDLRDYFFSHFKKFLVESGLLIGSILTAFHLPIFQFHRRGAAENRNRHTQLAAFWIDLFD